MITPQALCSLHTDCIFFLKHILLINLIFGNSGLLSNFAGIASIFRYGRYRGITRVYVARIMNRVLK